RQIGVNRVRGWRSTLLALIPLVRAWGCSCSPATFAPACERISTAEIVFVGKAVAIETRARIPVSLMLRFYRFQVETAYKGLPKGTTEVIVDPGGGSSCETRYTLGTRYLIFGSQTPGAKEVFSAACHGSRIADDHPDDLKFLEAYRRGQSG